MKSKIKLCFTCLMIFIVVVFIATSCLATDLGLGDKNSYKGTETDGGSLTSRIGRILGIIQLVGTIVSVAILVVIGIKYMTGSVEEKAEYKSSMIPYIVGAFLLFTGTYVPQLIYKLTHGVIG